MNHRDRLEMRQTGSLLISIALIIVIPIAIGLLFGAGLGWLTFGLILCFTGFILIVVGKKDKIDVKS